METERIRIEGMSCEHCVARVKGAVLAMNGLQIISVTVGELVVSRPASVTVDSVLAAIRSVGFSIVSTS